MAIRESLGEKIFRVFNYTALSLLGAATFYPFYYVLVQSLNDGRDALKGGLYFLPRVWTLANYMKAFEDPIIVNAFMITLFRTIVGTVLSVLLTAMAAYALARKDLPGRSAISFYFFVTTIFSGGMIPFFIVLRELHLTSTIWIYILPAVYSFFNLIVMRTYFQSSIPFELWESATIDGYNEQKIFFKIYLPLSLPMLATITLFVGVGHWNDWFTGAYYVTDKKLRPAATILQQILSEANFEQSTDVAGNYRRGSSLVSAANTTPESLRMAFVMIITIPIIFIYPFLQRYFVNGIMIGSIKG